MQDLIESSSSGKKRNPLFWVILVVIGLILFIVFGGDRGKTVTREKAEPDRELVGKIDRNLLVPPGLRARELIEQLRAKGQPFPLDLIFEKASEYQQEGSLADAHLLYFYSARQGHTASMMTMAEMSDPTRFRAEDSLLDHPDALVSYKWYQKVAALGDPVAEDRIRILREWAIQESEQGNSYARQLLLVVQ